MTTHTIDLQLVRTLPEQTLSLTIRSPKRSSDYTFKGALLMDYLRTADLLPVPAERKQGGLSNVYFKAAAGDGMTIAVAYAEVAGAFSGKTVMLAYEQDGEAMRAGLRLVVPGDGLGGRSIYGVQTLEVVAVPVPSSGAPGVRNGVELTGDIERPGRLSLAELTSLPRTSVRARAAKSNRGREHPERSLRGPRLYDVLDAAGIVLNPDIHEHFLRKVVVASSADGFAVVIAGGEIEPRFGNADVILAIADDNGALGEEDGAIRLAVPEERSIARHVRALSRIELCEA
jgi:hypothetical protein